MEQLLQHFQTRRAALMAPSGKRPSRYPDEVRDIALAYTKEARAQGLSHRVAAQSLGIDPATLVAWERRNGVNAELAVSRSAPPQLRRVEVVDCPKASTTAATLCVVGPRGVRVEGVSIEQVAVLFERLAC